MRILLSNDDGIGATGLQCLESIARTISDDIWIVAPELDRSGASHSLSLDYPLRYHKLGEKRFVVKGTPADCVLLGLLELIPPPKPGLILSGVNRGANLGDDVTYSGTVAAAMEGALHAIPAIALSQEMLSLDSANWEVAEQHGPCVIKRLLEVGWPTAVILNINFPCVSENGTRGVAVCRQGSGKPGSRIDRRVDPKGREYCWIDSARTGAIAAADSDRAAIESGFISLTPLRLDLTDDNTVSSLSGKFGPLAQTR
jgi:5'-nucleotidase